MVTGVPWPMAVGVTPSARPAGSSPSFSTMAGMPPGQDEEATSRWRSFRILACSSSQPRVSTSHFMRARSLLSRFPWLLNTRRQASRVAMRSSREVNSSRARAGWGLAPRPPATNTRKPGSIEPSSRRAGGGDDADVVEHGLAAVGVAAGEVELELAGQALGQRMAQEVLERGLGPGADVEDLVGAGAGEVAALDVADGVAAGLPGGQADRGRGPAARRGPAPGGRSGAGCSGGW